MDKGLTEGGKTQIIETGMPQGTNKPSISYFTQVSSALPERLVMSLVPTSWNSLICISHNNCNRLH